MLNQVFLSYRHESEGHLKRVRSFAEALRSSGLAVAFDQFFLETNPGGPDDSWARWSIRQAKESACVLIVGSGGWYKAFSDPASVPGSGGLGAAAEANVIMLDLYQSRYVASRHRIILLDSEDKEDLPLEISGWRLFSPAQAKDQEDLVLWISNLLNPVPADRIEASWPKAPPSLQWPLANHTVVRDAFSDLLTAGARYRCLLVRGSSESGKSHVTWQMLNNALRIPGLFCGRLDFKGTADVDAALRSFVMNLGVTFPGSASRLNERLAQILDQMKARALPTLLLFDTYEATDAHDWVQNQLLPSLVRSTWLRVVIAGQTVPDHATAVWSTETSPPIELSPPLPEDWFAFGQRHHSDLTLEFVQKLHRLSRGKPAILAQVFGPAK